jgi:hypothetical protein
MMIDVLPIHLFLNEALVDELWTLAKREGMTVERVKEAAAKLEAKGKFGFGKALSWLAADVSAELETGGSIKDQERLHYSSILRSILLRDLVTTVAVVEGSSSVQNALRIGAFIQVVCEHVEIIPVPTQAGYMRQLMMNHVGEALHAMENSAEVADVMDLIEKLTSSHRSFAFAAKLEDDNSSSALGARDEKSAALEALSEANPSAIANALLMSNDDQVLILGVKQNARPNVVVFSTVPEAGLRRSLAIHSTGRPVLFFGQVADVRRSATGELLLGIVPIAIFLQ